MPANSRFQPTIDHVREPERLLKVIRDLSTQLYAAQDEMERMRAKMTEQHSSTMREMEKQRSVLDGRKEGAGALAILGVDKNATMLSNLTATTAPTADNDSTQSYGIGSKWVDTSTDDVYFCTNASPGAAVWRGPL
jgi:TolA-binding protein